MSKIELVTSQQDDTVKCVPPWPLYIASWSNHKKAWFKQVTIKVCFSYIWLFPYYEDLCKLNWESKKLILVSCKLIFC